MITLPHEADANCGRGADTMETGCCAWGGMGYIAMESFFGSLKSEWLHHQRFETRQQAMQSIFYYFELFHNRRRLHSANGYRSPAQFENLAYARVH